MCSKVDIVWLIPALVSLSWINNEVDCCMHSSGIQQQISLNNNGYTGILIGIDEGVAENQELVEKIKEVFTAGSADLYTATRNRSYFKEITISVPKNWSDSLTYDPLTYERYDKSNIIIAEGQSGPYVAGVPECGVSGRYMHLTPQYILDPLEQRRYGTAGKLVVHEWGHLRYGVYDEYPRRSRDPIYYTSSSGTVEATRCSLGIQGEWSPECQVQNGEPTTGEDDGCRFLDSRQTGGYSASIMYKQFLPYMMDFCDTEDNADSSGMVHNYEAPTKQNVGCNYKSVWEVLNDHVDFRDDTNPPRSVASTVPTFKVVKRQCKRTVLVLDISGSMASYGRIYRLEQAVVNYINNDVQDGEYLGMVVFNSTAAVKSLLVEMNDEQRESMLLLVPGPGDVDGATSIGAGLLQGIEVLEQNGQNPNGGILLVVTDGEENTSPFIDDVLSEIQEKLITVDTIAIESEASIKLENLSSTTCGMSFFYSEGSNALKEAFSTSAQRDQEISSLPITLYSNSLTVYSSDNLVFHIDSTIGDKTKIVVDYIEYIGYNDTAIELTLELPDGSFITKNSPAYTLDSLFKIVTIQIPGLAQVGEYKLVINNPSSYVRDVTVTVQSRSREADQYPIMAVSEWSAQNVSPPKAAILNAAVTRGFTPVIGAMVVATIERPAGGPLTYTLRDNGAGADVTQEDGIYSMYFTDFNGTGRYSAKVEVENDGESTVVSPSKVTGFGSPIDPNVDSGDEDDTAPEDVSTGSFQRIATGGSLTCDSTECTYAAYRDFYPPARIDDLSVRRKNSDKGQVTFQFTAPGDDLDQGNATSYEFRVHQDFKTMLREFNKTNLVDREMVIEGDLLAPKPAGQTEEFTIEIKANTDSTVYVFSLVANDDYGNTSPQSNIVTVSLDPKSGIRMPVVAIVIIVLVAFVIIAVSALIICVKCKTKSKVTAGNVVP